MFSKKPKGATIYNDKKNGLSSLLWMLVGAVATLIIGVYAYKTSNLDIADTDIQVVETDTQADESQIHLKNEEANNTNFEFYEKLPNANIPTVITTNNEDEKAIDDMAEVQEASVSFKADVVIDALENTLDTQVIGEQASQEKSKEIHNTANATHNTSSNNSAVNNSAVNNSAVNNTKPTLVQFKPDSKAVDVSDDDVILVYGGEAATNEIADTQQEDTSENDSVDGLSALNTKTEQEQKETSDNKTEQTEDVKTAKNSEDIPSTIIEEKPAVQPTVQAKQGYILQINSYSDAEQADARRAQVLMTGIEANVIKNSAGFYQVISTPLFSPQEVIESQRKLQKSGIDSVIVEQRY